MITGVILDNGTPVIELKVRGSQREITVEGILDTGFTGFLCLLIFLAVPLGLALTDTVTSELADGTFVDDELVFAGQAEWDGVMMDIAGTIPGAGGSGLSVKRICISTLAPSAC